MAKALLINIQDIKNESIVPSNTDEKILLLALKEVTDLELEPLIGTTYLNKLNEGVLTKTLSDSDKEVIKEVIKPFLIYGALSYSIPYLHNKVNNKGVNVSTDSTLSSLSSNNVNSFQNVILNKWDSYKRRLITYFKNDKDLETNTNISADTTGNIGFFIPDRIDYGLQYYKARADKVNTFRGW